MTLVADPAPARPGPGPIPEPLLRTLDLAIRRRVQGMLLGEHRSSTLGLGSELAQIRPYVAGDDVRLIDWNVTARTNEPHVRVQVAERALTTWLVVDRSPSMAFGTADRRKIDVADGVAAAFGRLATRRAGRLGVVGFGSAHTRVVPAHQGRPGLFGLRTMLREEIALDAGETDNTSLRQALLRIAGVAKRSSLVVVVSDFRGIRDWERELRDLATTRVVLAVEIRDPREQELVDVGDIWLVDPETGRMLRVDTASRRLRERFADDAASERADLAASFRRAGVDHVVLTTEGDWLRELARYLRKLEARP